MVPAQHYFMGGVHVNSDSETTMMNFFALGETACNGVHGKNRLASNSLLESLVFAQRAARVVSSRMAKTASMYAGAVSTVGAVQRAAHAQMPQQVTADVVVKVAR